MKNLVYKMAKMDGGSDKFGVCECCGKSVSTTFLLTQSRVYKKNRLTQSGCFDKFGHKECLQLLAV